MLLLVLSCLTSLIGVAGAAGGPAGYSHVECGLRPSFESFLETGKRIGTGRSVQPGEFPWHVSIQSNRKHICGGTIISALWILTAAHCFAKELPPDLTVVVGGINLSVPLEEHKPDSLILHENFNSTSMANDIALILLSSPIEFSKEKIPICLPFMCDIHTWQHCWAAGWGSTTADAVPAAHVLQKARVKLIGREQCLKQIPQLQENVMCAEVEEGEGGNCQVDSGGPLVCSYWNTMKWFQVGIISEEKPNHKILTSVYSYLGWIENETAIRGKPFFIEGVDNGARPRVIRSGAGVQMVFLEHCFLLLISSITVSFLHRRFLNV
ncbi:serine protease 55-like [Myiozetetes cayanensis]|uniref:serine protease 55-like n=1 Tax=Myiozetetes cayanensis TaxID=478635 RepID=UPI00215DD60A|nr:serine protease 55-like [Myiozetetes cayanensis]